MIHRPTVDETRPSQWRPYEWANGNQQQRGWLARDLNRHAPIGLALGITRFQRRRWTNLARRALLNRDGQARCRTCGREDPHAREALAAYDWPGMPDPYLQFGMTVAHIVPLIDDGPHHIDNLAFYCPPCHRQRTAERNSARSQERRTAKDKAKAARKKAIAR